MEEQLPIALRPANASDVPFIFSTWLKSFRTSKFAEHIPNEIYFSEQHKAIEEILKSYNVIMAVNAEDPDQLYGFICAGTTDGIFTLHYIYVKHTFRRMGIGSLLLNSFQHDHEYAAIYTHRTRAAKILAERYNLIYHPYIAFNPAEYNKPVYNTKGSEAKK